MSEGVQAKNANEARQLNQQCHTHAARDLSAPISAGVAAATSRDGTVDLGRIPEGVRASVARTPGVYDARRLRSQREIIRDVMLSAAECETWLTLGELRALTRYGEASISAQLRHLRKSENGGYAVVKRHREGVSPERPGADGRGECIWEYSVARRSSASSGALTEQLAAVGV